MPPTAMGGRWAAAGAGGLAAAAAAAVTVAAAGAAMAAGATAFEAGAMGAEAGVTGVMRAGAEACHGRGGSTPDVQVVCVCEEVAAALLDMPV